MEHLDINETLEEFFSDCQAKGYAIRTITCYRSELSIFNYFLKEKGITSLTEISRDTLLEYHHYLQGSYRSKYGQPISVATRLHLLCTVKSFFKFCARAGKVLLNPAEDIPLPKKPKSLPRGILSKQQMKKLLKLPDQNTLTGYRDRIILELFYGTGIRRRELNGITVPDCYIQERRIFISKGKGNKQRWVPIGKKLAAMLREYLEVIRPALMKSQVHNALVVGDKGGAVSDDWIYRKVRDYIRTLGVKADCHSLRHTCATHLLKGKANIRVIQSLLGHQSLSSTQIYTHVDITDMAKAIEKCHPRENMECD